MTLFNGEGYDVVAGATTSPSEYQPVYTDAFGADPAVWEEASPLRQARIPTTVLDSRELGHADLTTLVGAPGDAIVTPALADFLGVCFEA